MDNLPVLEETKPGAKTTEFYLVVFANLVGVLELVADPFNIENKWVLLATALVTAAYAISRGQAKAGLPYVEEAAVDAPLEDDEVVNENV